MAEIGIINILISLANIYLLATNKIFMARVKQDPPLSLGFIMAIFPIFNIIILACLINQKFK